MIGDVNTYMPVLRELLEQGASLTLTVTGNSMAPFLKHGRDQIRFEKPACPARRGDMVFFRRRSGQYVMHRVVRTGADGVYLVGDGQQQVEGPIAPAQIFAVVTGVCRNGRWIGPGQFWWDFFAGPWLWLLPFRPLLRRLAGLLPEKFKAAPHD